ncbi:MAG: oligosaccharide flippase family protein [Candidatus Levybacteria bacterium]|nr:oligosaccharide flippase family protein [Candidatus Levybacteria bacterium]
MEDTDLQVVAKKSVQGMFALVSRSFLVQILAIVSNFVLTLYLDPSMFGVFFVVSAINVFLAYFQDIGLAALIIQKKAEPTLEELRTTFTIQQILVLLIVIPTYVFSEQIANTFNLSQDGIYVLYAYLASFVLSSLKTIPTALLERKLDFHKLVIPQIAESLVYSIALIVFAIMGYGVTTFTIAILLRSIIGLPLIYWIQPWDVGFALKRKLIKDLVSKGSPFQGNSILALIKDDLLNLYVASLLPLTQVGYIGFAQKWAFMPLRLVMDNVIKVTFPSYSRLQNDPGALKIVIEKSLFLISFIIFPIVAAIITFSPSLIDLIPGYQKWEPALIALMFFSLNSLFASITVPLTNVLNAIGKVNITLRYMVFWTILSWVLTVLFIQNFGYNGVAAASFVVAASVLLILYPVKKEVNFSFVRPIWKQLVAAIVMGLGVYATQQFITSWFLLIVQMVVAGTIYMGILLAIAQKDLKKVTKYIVSIIKKTK